MTKWEEWERIHAEQDARDRKIVIAVSLIIVLLVLFLAAGGTTAITG
jgi:flagellar basal body-associated protein FliL